MKVKDFNEKYVDKGGIRKLTEFRAVMTGQDRIAEHFGVTKERVRQWMLEFFGAEYDPRPDRKESIIASMVDFAIHKEREEFDAAFEKMEYYQEALDKCEELEIYDIER